MERLVIAAILLSFLVPAYSYGAGNGGAEAEINALQQQAQRVRSLISIAIEQSEKKLGEDVGGLNQSITAWEQKVAGYNKEIKTLDDLIKSTPARQRDPLDRAMEALLRRKADAEAMVIKLKMQANNKITASKTEAEQQIGQYKTELGQLLSKIETLEQVTCCANGQCLNVSRTDCTARGGTAVANCAENCEQIKCCIGGVCAGNPVTRAQCRGAGGSEIKYCAYECAQVSCRFASDRNCKRTTRADCEENGGQVVSACPDKAAAARIPQVKK